MEKDRGSGFLFFSLEKVQSYTGDTETLILKQTVGVCFAKQRVKPKSSMPDVDPWQRFGGEHGAVTLAVCAARSWGLRALYPPRPLPLGRPADPLLLSPLTLVAAAITMVSLRLRQ